MNDIPTGALFIILIVLIILSACFSGSETGLMSLNRYRLRHLAGSGHRNAQRASRLLAKPDRLIGLILLGNNFVNIAASFITTILTQRLWGDGGLAIAAGVLTLVILIFAEVTPKTLAALHPERVAFPSAIIYEPLLKVIYYPLVWPVSIITNSLLRMMGVSVHHISAHGLSTDELRTVVNEAGALIPQRHQQMLTSILDLEKVTVEDIMIPRNDIVGIDIDQELDNVRNQILTSQRTRIPVYHSDINNMVGFLHVRNAMKLFTMDAFSREDLLSVLRDPYYIPEGTSLNTQLLNFQREKRRIGLIVDEYGDIMGLVTLEDILEEIVGEFTTDPDALKGEPLIQDQDGSYLVNGTTAIRELNRTLNWNLSTQGPKTLNGLIMEYLEDIPEPGTTFRLPDCVVEIVQIKDNHVKVARLTPTSMIVESRPEESRDQNNITQE